MPATPEQREANTQQILKDFPYLTREDIEKWDKIGRPMREDETFEDLLEESSLDQ